MERIFVDAEGKYLGAYCGEDVVTPEGGIEVSTAPADARQVWNGEAWEPLPRRIVILDRLAVLDRIISRMDEDVAAKVGVALYGDKLAASNEKKTLRAELAGL